MNIEFRGITWHDTKITRVVLDRSNPGIVDKLELFLENDEFGSFCAIFLDVWRLTEQWNFGICADETIRCATEAESHPSIEELRRTWENLGANLDDIRFYRIETNSTASIIEILARRFEVNFGVAP